MGRGIAVLLVALLLAAPARGQEYLFTIAGGGPDDVPATQAWLSPYGVTADAAGNSYISSGSRIFKVDVSGRIRIFAGVNVAGFSGDGRHASLAQLDDPRGVTLDAADNVLIADYANHRVRSVDRSSGVISTIAGNGSDSTGGDGGPAVLAGLSLPHGLAVGSDGSIYISQPAANRVRRIDPVTGHISTHAGTGVAGFSGDGGPADTAQLRSPQHLAIDPLGNLLITDSGNRRIRRVDVSTGAISTVAGNGTYGSSGDGGPALQAGFSYPAGVAVDAAGNIFVADRHPSYETSGVIRKVDAVTGIITRYANAVFPTPEGVSLDAAGNLLIADMGICYFGPCWPGVRRILAATQAIETVAGGEGSDSYGDGGPAVDAILGGPEGVSALGLAVDNLGNLVLVQENHMTVRRVDASTGLIATIAGGGSTGQFCGDGGAATNACLWNPSDVALDSQGNVYIADTGNNRIRRVGLTGIIQTIAGDGTSSSLNRPEALTVDAQKNVFIADTYNHRIRRRDAVTGVMSTVAGTGFAGFSGDGQAATLAKLNQPRDISLDSSGNIFFIDRPRVRRVDEASGIINTVAGSGNFGYSGDGGPAVAADMAPAGIAVDGQGNLLILDEGNRVRFVDASTGIISTVAGNGLRGFSPDGAVATDASIHIQYWKAGIAYHPVSGFVFSDTRNGRVRKVEARSLAAGSVPDGSADPNQALEVNLEPDGRITLSWSPSCLQDDEDYEVFQGGIGGFDDPLPLLCSTEGLTTATFVPAPGSSYYLVAPRNQHREGSLGRRADGTERPQGTAACLDRMIAPACGP